MRLMQFAAAIAVFIGLAAAPAHAQDWRLNPNFGSANIAAGFTPDPYVVNVQAGGNLDVSGNISGCRGWITRQPDFRLNWSGHSGLPLIISVASNSDTTLVINGPNEQWICDDDGGNAGLNPSVTFASPQPGQYDIWVGTYASGALAPSRLFISELTSQ